jgi:hypothetical protein
MQFMDDRNKETVEKIASYPVIGELVSGLQRQERFASGGVITMGGEIPVDRSITGGMLAWFWGQGRWRSHHQWSQSDANYKYW